jgi:hypothetical protein
MNFNKMVEELTKQRDKLSNAIVALEECNGTRRGRPRKVQTTTEIERKIGDPESRSSDVARAQGGSKAKKAA